jgi:curved DNA-binding protein CbpA
MRALDVLDLEADSSFDQVKAAYRRLAKANHPDLKPGDKEAAERFRLGLDHFGQARDVGHSFSGR